MDKFTTNQFAEETTAADIYAMREEFRQEEQELAEIADDQWEAFQDDHESEYEWTEEAIAWEEGMRSDELYDYDELDEHDLRVAQAEWEAQQEAELSDFDPHRDFYAEMDDQPVMELPNDLYMVYDDPDYWG
tara:strand:+ start:1514 stop:1909 length:396 start_codon:yes stop_codon:yes gene_type:complete